MLVGMGYFIAAAVVGVLALLALSARRTDGRQMNHAAGLLAIVAVILVVLGVVL
jgi:hypothetical protein